MQKTWVDLLGTDVSGVFVSGQYLCRETGSGTFHVIWRADDRVMAAKILEARKREVSQLSK